MAEHLTVSSWQKALREAEFESTYPYIVDQRDGGMAVKRIGGGAVKSVLIFLSTWANYDDGTEARPGTRRLATASNTQGSRVAAALTVAIELGWIELATPGDGGRRADEYRLTLPTRVPQALADSASTASKASDSGTRFAAGSAAEASDSGSRGECLSHSRASASGTHTIPNHSPPSSNTADQRQEDREERKRRQAHERALRDEGLGPDGEPLRHR